MRSTIGSSVHDSSTFSHFTTHVTLLHNVTMRSTIGSRGAWLAVKRRKHWSHTVCLCVCVCVCNIYIVYIYIYNIIYIYIYIYKIYNIYI